MPTNSTKHKIYCFNNGGSPGFPAGIAIDDLGLVVAGHLFGCVAEMPTHWNRTGFDAFYGEGNWELEWVFEPDSHDGLQRALKLNRGTDPDSH